VIEYRFQHCRVTIDDAGQRVETVFDDGAVVAAIPEFDDESIARARALGYRGTDDEAVWSMTRHHDLMHTVIAEAEGHPYSPTLHAVGHGYHLPPGAAEREERVVFVAQRMLNEGLEAVIAESLRTDPPD